MSNLQFKIFPLNKVQNVRQVTDIVILGPKNITSNEKYCQNFNNFCHFVSALFL